ncbi:nucleotide-binding protein [Halocatena halophila]|uniref:nucleotide-binding protein n=1 Tax=Halocatena halophila TaxID=2814576 RepID=UPI002ED2F760
MVEAFAVASGKGGVGKTTSTLALGMALSDRYDVTVVDADTGMANLLFHTGLDGVETTLHDVLGSDVPVSDAVYERFGMRVVPCGTSLSGFRRADPDRLRGVVATLARDTDVLLLDSAPALGAKSAVLPVVLADRVVVVVQPTIPSLSDALKVQEYATAYGTSIAGVLFNRVQPTDPIERISEAASRYFDGPIIGRIPERPSPQAARRAGKPVLAHAPESSVADAYRGAADRLEIRPGDETAIADRFQSAVIPEQP